MGTSARIRQYARATRRSARRADPERKVHRPNRRGPLRPGRQRPVAADGRGPASFAFYAIGVIGPRTACPAARVPLRYRRAACRGSTSVPSILLPIGFSILPGRHAHTLRWARREIVAVASPGSCSAVSLPSSFPWSASTLGRFLVPQAARCRVIAGWYAPSRPSAVTAISGLRSRSPAASSALRPSWLLSPLYRHRTRGRYGRRAALYRSLHARRERQRRRVITRFEPNATTTFRMGAFECHNAFPDNP